MAKLDQKLQKKHMLDFCESGSVKGRQLDSCMAQLFSSISKLNASAQLLLIMR